MKCRRADPLFSAAWEDELTVAERETLEAHIERCAACRASYDGFVRVMEAVQEMPRTEVTSDFTDGVWSRIRAAGATAAKPRAARVSGGWLVASFRMAAAAAACLAVVVGVVSYVNRPHAPVSSPVAQFGTPALPSPAALAPPLAQATRPRRAAGSRPLRELAKIEPAPSVAAPRTMSEGSLLADRQDQTRSLAASAGDTSGGLDTLFNHAYDVEFALDPVHLKRVGGQGRLTPARATPSEEVGKRASVTF